MDLQNCDKYCVLRSASLWFAVPAASVREVLSHVPLVALPQANEALAGLCHLRSEFLPVLRLNALVGGPESQACGGHLLVMLGTMGPWALLVDQAVGLERLESVMGASQPHDDWSAAVLGTATCGEQVVRILDPAAIYRLGERLLKTAWSTAANDNVGRADRRDTPVGIPCGETAL